MHIKSIMSYDFTPRRLEKIKVPETTDTDMEKEKLTHPTGGTIH